MKAQVNAVWETNNGHFTLLKNKIIYISASRKGHAETYCQKINNLMKSIYKQYCNTIVIMILNF